MQLICPECRADLMIADTQNATCAAHDGRYQILFDRSSTAAAAPATQVPAPAPAVEAIPPTEARRPPTVPCQQHPEVLAVTRCRVCSKGVCAVCDFVLPGDLHVCPACLEKEPPTEIAPGRRVMMVVAFVIAPFSTLLFVLARTGELARATGSNPIAAMVLGNLMLWTAIAGLVLGLCAYDRRLRNSTGIGIAVAWNAINLGIFVLSMIIGLASK